MENKKGRLLLELFELTKMQEQALIKEDIEEFERLITERQTIMRTIDELQPQDYEQKEEEILKQIIEMDNSNLIEFKKQLESVKSKLKGIREKKKRENFYSNPYNRTFEEGVFYDKKEF